MNTIARNAIYAATTFMLWPHALSANNPLTTTAQLCPPLLPPQFSKLTESQPRTPALTSGASSAGVSFEMHPGRLQPQLERVLRQHMGIQHVLWQAASEHEWPTSYQLEAASWGALVESLLSPYQLRMQLFANHSAVISYQSQTGVQHGY